MLKEINQEIEVARKQGREDFRAGNGCNPYAEDSAFYRAWQDGFTEAYKDFDVRR